MIGEAGTGEVNFLVKTQFGNACLKPVNLPLKVYPESNVTLTFTSNATDLRNATLYYSIDGWKNFTALGMQLLDNRTCKATIPAQPAGTTVNYRVEALDVLENLLVYSGSYTVKYASTLSLDLTREAITIGENISIIGRITPATENLPITIVCTSANETLRQTVYTLVNGTFKASKTLKFKVEPPSFLSRYSICILPASAHQSA